MATYVWLMFYYYVMIVPSQRALFLWVKKNITYIIYILMTLDRLFFLGLALLNIHFIVENYRFPNGTEGFDNEISIAFFSIDNVYMFLCLSLKKRIACLVFIVSPLGY